MCCSHIPALVDEVQAQRVVVVGHRGEHRPDVLWT